MKKISSVLTLGLIIILPIFADYVELGTGGSLLLNRPYCGSWGNEIRYQVLVLTDELAGLSSIEEVRLLCGSAQYNFGTFYNAAILVCPTSLSQLTTNYNDNYQSNTPQIVFSAETLELNWTNNEWHGFIFDYSYQYNGSDNLIFEFRWQGDNSNAVYVKGWYPPSGNRVLDGFSLSNPIGTLRTYMNSIRIYYTPLTIDETPLPRLTKQTIFWNQPNLFSKYTTISYHLPKGSDVEIHIYNSAGKLIKTMKVQKQAVGFHSVKWPGEDQTKQRVSEGIYFYHFKTDNYSVTKKILFLK